MQVVITERLDDIRHDVDAAHANLVFVLDPDEGRPHLGYAAVLVAAPIGRRDGVAVVAGDAALGSVPDPVRILVRDASGPDPTAATICVRRRALPLLVRVDGDTARVMRRILPDPLAARVATAVGADLTVGIDRDDALPTSSVAVEE